MVTDRNRDGMNVTPLDESTESLVFDTTAPSLSSIEDADTRGGLKMTSLHSALAEGNIGIVKSLLNRGANVDESNKFHQTALHVASRNMKPEVIKLLIEYGADVNS
jgi:ankyrin repeat protein